MIFLLWFLETKMGQSLFVDEKCSFDGCQQNRSNNSLFCFQHNDKGKCKYIECDRNVIMDTENSKKYSACNFHVCAKGNCTKPRNQRDKTSSYCAEHNIV